MCQFGTPRVLKKVFILHPGVLHWGVIVHLSSVLTAPFWCSSLPSRCLQHHGYTWLHPSGVSLYTLVAPFRCSAIFLGCCLEGYSCTFRVFLPFQKIIQNWVYKSYKTNNDDTILMMVQLSTSGILCMSFVHHNPSDKCNGICIVTNSLTGKHAWLQHREPSMHTISYLLPGLPVL